MIKQRKIEWMEILFWIIIIALFIMILTRIFGKSATDIQIYLGFITGLSMVMGFLAKRHREIGEIKVSMKHSFEKVREDIRRLESKIDVLANKLDKKYKK